MFKNYPLTGCTLSLLMILLGFSSAFSQATSITSPTFPANRTANFPIGCTGPNCDGDCTFSEEKLTFSINVKPGKLNGIDQQVISVTLVCKEGVSDLDEELTDLSNLPAAAGDAVEGTASVTNGKIVSCPEFGQVPQKVTIECTVMAVIEDSPNDQVPNTQTKEETFIYNLSCVPWPEDNQSQSYVEGNGFTTVATQLTDQSVTVMFTVINFNLEPSLMNLNLTSSQPWDISPPIPSSLEMAPGEAAEFLLDVTVPAGVAPGAVNEIELAAAIDGIPGSESADTVTISVIETVPTLSEWGLFIFFLLLLTLGVKSILKKQQALAFAEAGNGGPLVNSSTGTLTMPPRSAFFIWLLTFGLGINVVWLIYGEILAVDYFGTAICAGLITYLIHLILPNSKE